MLKSSNNSNEISKDMNISVLSKINNSTIPKKTSNIPNETFSKDDALNTIHGLINSCQKNVDEIEENKKNMNKSILLENTMINERSFYMPNIQVLITIYLE